MPARKERRDQVVGRPRILARDGLRDEVVEQRVHVRAPLRCDRNLALPDHALHRSVREPRLHVPVRVREHDGDDGDDGAEQGERAELERAAGASAAIRASRSPPTIVRAVTAGRGRVTVGYTSRPKWRANASSWRSRRASGWDLASRGGCATAASYQGSSTEPASSRTRSQFPSETCASALTGGSGMHAILDVVVTGTDSTHPSILKDYQQDPLRGKLVHVDLQEVRLDRPISATVTVVLTGGDDAPGVREGGALSQVAREVNVEALPMEVPEHLELDVSGWRWETACASPISRRSKASRSSTTRRRCWRRSPSRCARRPERQSPKASRPRARSVPRAPRAKAPKARASPAPSRASACGCRGAGAKGPRRSTCSSSASAIREGSTRGTATTSAGWSSTSSPAGTAPRGVRSSTAASQNAPRRAPGRAARTGDVHERFGTVGRRRGEVLQGRARRDPGRARRGRLRPRAASGAQGRRPRRPQRPRSIAQHLGTQDFLRLRVGVGRPDAATGVRSRTTSCPTSSRTTTAEAIVSRAADAVETLDASGLERAQARFN